MTSPEARERLMTIARQSVAACVGGGRFNGVFDADALARRAGAFVSLHRHGELRGCIGHIEADRPLARVVADCARAACEDDPRFPRLGPTELEGLEIEISILGPLTPVSDLASIVVGRDGLLVEHRGRRGLLLPQVATARHWSAAEFVAQTCEKAGLARDAWRSGAALWRFDAEVFSGDAVTADDRAPDFTP